MKPRRKRILIADEHPVTRRGLRELIDAQPDLMVCGEVRNARQALSVIDRLHPDVAVIELSTGGSNGLSALRSLHTRYPQLPLLVFAVHANTLIQTRALRAGARGYLDKSAAKQEVLKALRQIIAGELYVGAATETGQAQSPRLDHLTNRELEVLQLLGLGKCTEEIANDLCVGVATVHTFRANVKRKLNVRTASDLIRFAVHWMDHPS